MRLILDKINFHFKLSIANISFMSKLNQSKPKHIFYVALLEIIKSPKNTHYCMYFSSSSKISFLHPAPTVNNSMEISKNHCFIPLFCKYPTAFGHITANLHHHTPIKSTWIKEVWELNSAFILSESFHILDSFKSQNIAGRYCETLLSSHAWGNL